MDSRIRTPFYMFFLNPDYVATLAPQQLQFPTKVKVLFEEELLHVIAILIS